MIKITQVQASTKQIRWEQYVMQTNIFLTIPKKTSAEEREHFQEIFHDIGAELEEAMTEVLRRSGLIE